MLATENCFEHMTRLSERLTGKNGTNRSPCAFFHQQFFRCNISDKSAMYPLLGQTAHFLGSTLFKSAGSYPPGTLVGPRTDFLRQF
jgi:hypothetical protein